MENTLVGVLSWSVIGLMVTVTGGVIYLTLSDWSDRRRLEQEKRENRRR
jgi:hypothetical protein